jgi:predicted  nucleic acid-binding Zn-ribbon protein
MENGWEVYSKMVLKQLEDLAASMNSLRQEILELKSEIVELRAKESKVDDIKIWKDKLDEVCSPTQLKVLKEEVEELKTFKTTAVTVFAVVQFVMGIILFAKDLL